MQVKRSRNGSKNASKLFITGLRFDLSVIIIIKGKRNILQTHKDETSYSTNYVSKYAKNDLHFGTEGVLFNEKVIQY